MRVPRAVARFNRLITNPLALSLGGWAPLQGTLEHVGRKSGVDGLLANLAAPNVRQLRKSENFFAVTSRWV